MKYKHLVFFLLILMADCKSVMTTTSQTSGIDFVSQKALKGNWQITNVSGLDYFAVKSFQIADSKCFIGSKWSFVPNNNKGTLSLDKSGCPLFSSPIIWSITKEGVFSLKFINHGSKAKKVTEGYHLKIANQTANSFQLIDQVDVAGNNKQLVYQFEKL